MVKTHSISLACVQGRTNEAGPPEGELHRGRQEDAQWSEAIRQSTVLDNRCRLVNSRWHKFQLHDGLEICCPRGLAL